MIYHEIVEEMMKSNINIDNISENIVNLFKPFFHNENNLKRYAKDYLIQDYINYKRNSFMYLDILILEVLNFYNEALELNKEETLKAFAIFQSESINIGNKYWSMCILQKDFSTLKDNEYVMEAFQLIENISEILLKKYFSLMVYLNRIIANKPLDLDSVRNLSFGSLYNELIQSNKFKDLFSILKSDISINQWRNIACHKDYQYIKGKIHCSYGKNKSKHIIIQVKEDLLDITKDIYHISQVINFSFKFFSYDNICEIYKYINISNQSAPNRDETWHLIFVTELYANGYQTIDIQEDDNNIRVLLKDMFSNQDVEKRAIQSSIALYKLWCFTEKDNLAVTYITNNNIQYMNITCKGEICRAIDTGNKDILFLAENANFIKLK